MRYLLVILFNSLVAVGYVSALPYPSQRAEIVTRETPGQILIGKDSDRNVVSLRDERIHEKRSPGNTGSRPVTVPESSHSEMAQFHGDQARIHAQAMNASDQKVNAAILHCDARIKHTCAQDAHNEAAKNGSKDPSLKQKANEWSNEANKATAEANKNTKASRKKRP